MSSASRSRAPGWLPILTYHRVVDSPPPDDPAGHWVTAGTFERHLRWLAAHGYSSLPVAAVGRAFDDGAGIPDRLPLRAVVLTFDDGYRDNYDLAWPLMKRYGFTATIFLVSESIGGYNRFDADLPGAPVPMLSWEQVREMGSAGIAFGSHTCTHPSSLIGLDDNRLRYELEGSKATLEEMLNAPVDQFSYPHDQLDGRVEAAVASAGYTLACAGVGSRFSRYCLNRVSPPRRGDIGLAMGLFERRLKWRIRNRLLNQRVVALP
jgi:peptidoglycan/xylan/chitin deacetylase (PgdA/CDA1 family)